jgi:hypothetical protein
MSMSVASAFLLAGCGGGSDGGDTVASETAAEITSDNAQTIAAATVSAALQTGGLSDFAGFMPVAMASMTPESAELYATLAEIHAQYADQLQHKAISGTSMIVVSEETTPCALSGTVTVTIDVASESTIRVGDTITAVFSACSDSEGVVVNGTFAMTISAFDGDPFSEMLLLGVDVEVSDFSVTSGEDVASMDGTLGITIDTRATPVTVVTVSAPSLVVSHDGATHTLSSFTSEQTLDGSATSYSLEMSGTLASSGFEGTVDFETTIALQSLGDSYAFAGELLITGADGATILLLVVDNVNVDLVIDTDGDGEVDDTLNTTWEALLAAA